MIILHRVRSCKNTSPRSYDIYHEVYFCIVLTKQPSSVFYSRCCLCHLSQIPRQPGHNQQLPRSHVVDLNHVSHHWLRGHGTKHILWERSLSRDWHYGEKVGNMFSVT